MLFGAIFEAEKAYSHHEGTTKGARREKRTNIGGKMESKTKAFQGGFVGAFSHLSLVHTFPLAGACLFFPFPAAGLFITLVSGSDRLVALHTMGTYA